LRRNTSVVAFLKIWFFNLTRWLTCQFHSLLELFLHSIDIFDFNDLINLSKTNGIRVHHLRLDLDHVIEISDREVIAERVPPFDLPIPGPLVEERVGPLAIPLLLALRRVLMYLLVYLAGVEVRDCDGAVLGDTHEVAALFLVDPPRTPIGHE
jgi:hypothetical protein